jgi:hypothetical protein
MTGEKVVSISKISDSVALQQLESLLDYYEIGGDDFPEKKQKDAFEMTCARLKKAIMKGRLTVSVEDGIKITQRLKKTYGETTELEYQELSGKNKVAMGQYEETEQHKKIYALLGSLTSLGESGIEQLKAVDLSTAECLGFLFLQV